MKAATRSLLLLALVAAPACTTIPPYDYSTYFQHMPTSILVLPPLNESPDPKAPYVFLSTITVPLAERGYYVFPVAVVDQLMKENGLPTAGEMHQVPLHKLREVFGADVVLYPVVKSWGTDYVVVDSQTRVAVQARLVDLRTGDVLWEGSHAVVRSSGGGGNIISMMVNALVNQVATSMYDPTYGLSMNLNQDLFCNSRRGLLVGPLHPEYAKLHEERLREWREWQAKQAKTGGEAPASGPTSQPASRPAEPAVGPDR